MNQFDNLKEIFKKLDYKRNILFESENNNINIYLIKTSYDKLPIFQINIRKKANPKVFNNFNLVNLKSIEFDIKQNKNDGMIRIKLENDEFIDQFFLFFAILFPKIINLEDVDSIVSTISSEIQKLDEFFRVNYVSDSKIQGLFGELKFIDKFKENMTADSLLQSWQTPDGLHDFEFSSLSVEIKTSIDNRITISSEKQLSNYGSRDLYIYHLKVKKMKKFGEKISQLEKNIKNKLNNPTEFDKKLISNKYKEDIFDRLGFEIISDDFYKVDEEFPKINISEINKNISNLSYQINLSSQEKTKTSPEVIFRRINGRN